MILSHAVLKVVSDSDRLFLLEGVITFAVALAGFVLLPDTPSTTRWLTPEERELAHGRMVRDNINHSDEIVPAMEGLKQACNIQMSPLTLP